jgi:tartrate-resistant acid phosphatase type 5
MHKLLVTSVLFLSPLLSFAQEPPAPKHALSEAILNRLPADYREHARNLTATDPQQAHAAQMSDEELAAFVITAMGSKPEGSEFLVGELDKEPSAKLRAAIVQAVGRYWLTHPESQKVLEQHAASDPDADVSLKAVEALRRIRMYELNRMVEGRLAMAAKAGDAAGATELGKEEELSHLFVGETMLPAFLRVPPPVFSVKPADQPIRVLAFGDFGTGSPAQIHTAKAMVDYHKLHPFDFGLTLGDNFYSRGMTSPDDPRWQTQWEQLYGPMGIKFYATLGNHDWGSADSPAAEILYSQKSPDWRMPAPYYTFTAGAVQFFAFDTVEINEAELEWLDAELKKSTAPWKVVYGHYHIYSATRLDNKVLIDRLLPVLKKNHVNVYLNGHDHNLQEEKPEEGVHFFVSGGGGAGLYEFNPYDRTIFKQKLNGFTVLEADAKHLKVSFVGTDGKELHQRTLAKGE